MLSPSTCPCSLQEVIKPAIVTVFVHLFVGLLRQCSRARGTAGRVSLWLGSVVHAKGDREQVEGIDKHHAQTHGAP